MTRTLVRPVRLRRRTPLKKPSRKFRISVRKADIIASRAVKERDGCCLRCKQMGKPMVPVSARGLQAAHIFTRRILRTRFLHENMITLCAGHHSYFHANPGQFLAWVVKSGILTGEHLIALRQYHYGWISLEEYERRRDAT